MLFGLTMRTVKLTILVVLIPALLQAADCEEILHADTLLRPGVIVLLGEIHGTEQGPALAGALACRAIALGLNVNIGLEIPITEQSRIDRYLQSKGGAADRDSLLAGEFWQREYQDGRASAAMAGLIESLRQLSTDSATALRVIALDGSDDTHGRDWFMAQRLIAALPDAQQTFTVALTGNNHNRLTIGTHFDPAYEPMGYVVWLHRPENEVISLEITHSGGTAWVDVGGERPGVVKLSGEEAALGVELYSNSTDEPYTGRCHVGAITASLPATNH